MATDPRARAIAIAIALLAAPAVVIGDVWDEPRVVDLRDSPATVAAALAVGAALVAALMALFARVPAAFPILAFSLLPIRVPLEIGGETANLLVPLYLVIAAQAANAWIAAFKGRAGHRGGGAGGGEPRGDAVAPRRGWTAALRYLLAATVALYAVQSAYSEDVSNAIENSGFFLAPFAVLLALLLDVRWSRELLARLLVALAAVAVALAAVGLGQQAARDLFLNEELLESNQLHRYFRVNSIFFDPNIFGRYMALAITALAAYLAWARDPRLAALAAAAAGLCLAGLAFSYSITSVVALLAGLAVLAALRWRWRGALAVGGLGAAALAALLVAGGTPSSDVPNASRDFDSGRRELIEGGLELAADRPLAGWGSGSFGAAFYERVKPVRSIVSHAEPVTVAAEQGAIGFLVYLGVIAAAIATLFAPGVSSSTPRAAVGACFVALLVHSLGYAGFAIDPATWALLGLGLGLAGGD